MRVPADRRALQCVVGAYERWISTGAAVDPLPKQRPQRGSVLATKETALQNGAEQKHVESFICQSAT